MMNENFIKRQLMAGKTSDEIFSDFAEAMEKATQEYDEIQKKKKEDEAKAAEKLASAEAIMDAIYFFVEKYYDVDTTELRKAMGGKEFIEIFDNVESTKNLKFPLRSTAKVPWGGAFVF